VTFQPDYVKKRVMEYKKTFKKLFNRVNEIAYGFGDLLPITIDQFLLFGNSIYERMLMKDNIESEFTKYLRLVRHDQQSLGRFC
jgi:hypothetical protein